MDSTYRICDIEKKLQYPVHQKNDVDYHRGYKSCFDYPEKSKML